MKTVSAILLCAIALSGCDACEPKFKDGDFVRHRIVKKFGDGIVLHSGSIKNLEGYCLVDVRWEAGNLVTMDVHELEPRP